MKFRIRFDKSVLREYELINREAALKKNLEMIFFVKNRIVVNEKEKILTIFGI